MGLLQWVPYSLSLVGNFTHWWVCAGFYRTMSIRETLLCLLYCWPVGCHSPWACGGGGLLITWGREWKSRTPESTKDEFCGRQNKLPEKKIYITHIQHLILKIFWIFSSRTGASCYSVAVIITNQKQTGGERVSLAHTSLDKSITEGSQGSS